MTGTQSALSTAATAPTRHVEVAGNSYAYREIGTKGGVPLVFLHHFTATIDDWDPRVLDGVGAERHVIIFDNRGVGGSSGNVQASIEAMADDAVAFINALGFEYVDLFGFSLGGFIAQTVTLNHPDLVRKLILAGTGPSGYRGVGDFNRRLLADAAQGGLKRQDPKPFLFFTRTKNGKVAAADYMARITERSIDRVPKTSPWAAATQLLAIRRWAQTPMDLSKIHQPTLVANGDDDRMLATSGSEELARRIPNAQLVIYPDAGHGGVFQHYWIFVPAILKFLK